jgi:hypothetical protein
MINAPTNINQSSTYDELSKQFKELYPAAYRAFQLIPLMYNRLTLVDNFSHKAALKKMYNDHKDLPGFSSRNIQRYLPDENPKIPRRVKTRRHNSSNTQSESSAKLIDTKLSYPLGVHSKDNVGILREAKTSKEIECPSCVELLSKNQELQDALEANSKFTPASQLIGAERVYSIPKEKWYILTEAIKKSEKACFAIFDNTGNFVYAEADVERMTHDVSHDSKN